MLDQLREVIREVPEGIVTALSQAFVLAPRACIEDFGESTLNPWIKHNKSVLFILIC
jgi:hypothetical protein